ncbi:MAG: acyl-CoA dehydrogenase family protein, partial [Oscillospiraceae bacterium]|nr:acyl-CoA dehydrogenase family protein [Oscillospiraceae bacterium]
MTFELTREQNMLAKMIRDFANNEVAPLAEEVDKTSRFPQETFDKMA